MNLEIQRVYHCSNIPDDSQIKAWAALALLESNQDSEILIRIVDENESAALNQQYRQKTCPTNVLSFPFDAPENPEINLLGDLVVCAPVIEKEARQQGKSANDHWAHIILHGILHLQGFDHIDKNDAVVMEALEIKLLKTININNPYFQENER
jgi:probable rRNA maturation factor